MYRSRIDRMTSRSVYLVLLLAVTLMVGSVSATYTWQGPSLNGQWNEPTNWSPMGVPSLNDQVIFQSPSNITSIVITTNGNSTSSVVAGIQIKSIMAAAGKLLVKCIRQKGQFVTAKSNRSCDFSFDVAHHKLLVPAVITHTIAAGEQTLIDFNRETLQGQDLNVPEGTVMRFDVTDTPDLVFDGFLHVDGVARFIDNKPIGQKKFCKFLTPKKYVTGRGFFACENLFVAAGVYTPTFYKPCLDGPR